MIRLELAPGTEQQRRDEAMVSVCCDEFESMLMAGVLRAARGLVFIFAGNRGALVTFCPFCGEEATRVTTPAPVEEQVYKRTRLVNPGMPEFVIVDGVRRCGRCRHTGHYARNCPER